MDYIVIGKFSEIDWNDFIVKDNLNEITINPKILKSIIVSSLVIIISTVIGEHVEAAEIVIEQLNPHSSKIYTPPTELHSIFEFIRWFIWLAKWVFSGVVGAIFTVAGWKWGTDLSGNGQTAAKKIMGNCIVGGLIIWTGATVANVFVNKMEEILG